MIPVNDYAAEEVVMKVEESDNGLNLIDEFDEQEEEIVVVREPQTYSLISGVHKQSKIYVDNEGFKYYKREGRKYCVYLVCTLQKKRNAYCPGTAKISTDLKDNSIQLQNYHNHKPRKIDRMNHF